MTLPARRLPPDASRVTRAILLAVVLFTAGCNTAGKPALRKRTQLMMDTYVTITAYGPAGRADKAIDDAFTRLEAISRRFNHLDSTSPVFAFNTRNEPLTDPEVVEVLKAAVAVSRASDGAFDVTVQPLVRLWGFYSGNTAVPPQRAIDSCLRLVGYRYLEVESARVTKLRPDVTIDLGGIAKGFGLREAARVLRSQGIDSAVIDLGGDVLAIGRHGDRNWKVGIRHPRRDGLVGVAEVSNLAVVTSGDYERFFFAAPHSAPSNPGTREPSTASDSVRYCHIIDPRTGWPARGLVSTTVVMRDPLTAQAWSKVLFIRGMDGLRLLDSVGGIEALVVTDSLKVIATPGLAGALELQADTGGI